MGAEAWPCDDYLPPLTCWTTPKPKPMVCEGCRVTFLRGPEVQRIFAARIADLEAQLAAARSALAACREVAGKRAGDDA